MSTSVSDVFSSLGLKSTPTPKSTQLGQTDFLRLMSTQLQNQDPLKPLDSQNFLAQLAQFSTVSGIESLNSSFGTLASSLNSGQALQAAALVGQRVLVPSEAIALTASGAEGAVDVPADASAVTITIVDASGATVRKLDLGAQTAGTARFTWDGTDENGTALAAGRYQVKASGIRGGTSQALDTLSAAPVDSVTLDGSSGLVLNLSNLGPVAFGDVRQILSSSH